MRTLPQGRVTFSPNGHKAPRPNRLRRLYVILRRLVRRRQESAATKAIRRDCEKTVEITVDDCDRRDREAEAKVKEVLADTAREVRVMAAKIDAKNQELDALRQLLERTKEDYQQMLRSRDQRITSLAELEIPQLQRKLEVEQEYSQHLATLVKKKLVHEEAEIAVENLRIVVAEGSVASAGAQTQQLVRGG